VDSEFTELSFKERKKKVGFKDIFFTFLPDIFGIVELMRGMYVSPSWLHSVKSEIPLKA
jgi:hypothetical protein